MFKSIFCGLSIFCLGAVARAQGPGYVFSEEDKIYQKVADVNIAYDGEVRSLSGLYSQGPVVIALIYTRCSGVCNPFLLQVKENMLVADSDERSRVLVVSFDPRDGSGEMRRLAIRYGLDNDGGWIFATTPQISELINSVGFNPVWDSVRAQFDHEALLVGINDEGFITRKLTGLRDFNAFTSLLRSIRNEFILSYPLPNENMVFSCFSYNPETGKNQPGTGLLLLLLPALLSLVVVFVLSRRHDRKPRF
ncbi:MAG: hypothetical protein EPGJADBJ_04233 [Saprospiraceae bacterium]|nr:hypothetical protein [Saprospiraceae bacterium]